MSTPNNSKQLATQLIEALTLRGLPEVPCRSPRYRQFGPVQENGQPKPRFYFVGKNGGFRFGRSPSDSIGIMRIDKWLAFRERRIADTTHPADTNA